jgi:GMP synthase-like glutamine amidotransferase
MAPLQDFVRELAAEKIPLIGVCFGHQIIAQALGGEVVKSDKGWGVGLHRYDLEKTYPWMKTDSQQASMYVFHQDQVVRCPAAAEVFLSSEFCPYAVYRHIPSSKLPTNLPCWTCLAVTWCRRRLLNRRKRQ